MLISKQSSFPFHYILFSFLPLYVLFTVNSAELYLIDLFLASVIIVIPAILLWIGLTFLFKSSVKSGLFVSLSALTFFSYGYLYIIINQFVTIFEIPHWLFIIPFLLILFLGFIYCSKTCRKLNNATIILNVISITLILVSSIQLITDDFTYQYDHTSPYDFKDDIDISVKFGLTDSLDKYPDIYYIILDEYAGSKILENTFNFDNNEFINFLNTNGFHTLENTRSNYQQSFLSLSSSLNLQYLTELTNEIGINSKNRHLVVNSINDNRLMQILELNGYEIVNFYSGWGPTEYFKIVDQNRCEHTSFINSDLIVALISNSILKPIYADLLLPNERSIVLCVFSELPELQFESEKPLFVFAHMMIPHPPYIWGPNGEHKKVDSLSKGDVINNKQDYVDQIIFTNKMVQEMITKLVENNERSEIIIIQSDHGHAFQMDYENPTKKMKHDRMSNITYILLPDDNENLLYDTITPVNIFRIIFNSYFNTDFELLEDRVYYSGSEKPYNFTDITHIFPDT